MRKTRGLVSVIVVALVSLACGGTTLTNTPAGVPPVNTQGYPVLTQVTLTPTHLVIAPDSTPTAIKIPATAVITSAFPTSNLPDLEFLCFQDYVENGFYHIIGEVRNNTHSPMGFVKISMSLHDDNNNLTGSGFTYALLDVIPSGGKSPFDIATDLYAGTTKYFLAVEGEAASLGRQDLMILNDKSSEEDGYLHIKGLVENKGSSDATAVKVVFTLYDRWGTVIGLGSAYTTLATLPAGGSSSFDASTDHYPNFDHYILQVQGK